MSPSQCDANERISTENEPETRPLLANSNANPADAIEEAPKEQPDNPYWQLRLILTVVLGIAALATLGWLASFGFLCLYEALAMAGYQNTFQTILGAQGAGLLVGAAIYPKIHHSSAGIYAYLADNWLGQMLGLRTHAGRWGLASRALRTLAAISYGILIALVCLDVTTLGKLMTPYLITMGITWLGIAPGIVANNAKIEQLFETELRWLDQVKISLTQLQETNPTDFEAIKSQLTVGTEIPHGLRTLWTAQRSDLFTALFIRKVHDVNSGIGSLLSLTRFVSTIILPLFYAFSITIPPVFFAVVIGSSILSSVVTWYTNWSRLEAHRKMITDIQCDYWKVQRALDTEKVDKVDALSKKIIDGLKAFPSNPSLASSITFHLKKALLEHEDFIPEDNQKLIQQLTDLLDSVIQPEGYRPTFLERTINRDQHGTRHGLANSYHFFGYEKTTTHSAEGLFILENQIAQRIIESKETSQTHNSSQSKSTFEENYKKVSAQIKQEAPQAKQEHIHLLTFGLVTAHSRKHKDELTKPIEPSTVKQTFFKDRKLDTQAILENDKEGIEDPHGRRSLASAIWRQCCPAA